MIPLMTLVADIPARGAPAHGAERLGRDQRMAVGRAWLCMLAGLAEIGMRCATFLTHGIAPASGEPRRPMMAFRFRGDPFTAFERVARAVRLAVALVFRIEAELRALRSGQSLGLDALLSGAPAPRATAMNAVPEAEEETAPLGDRGREVGLEALSETAPTPERPESLGGELNEDLREDDEFYRLLNGPLKNAVAAIWVWRRTGACGPRPASRRRPAARKKTGSPSLSPRARLDRYPVRTDAEPKSRRRDMTEREAKLKPGDPAGRRRTERLVLTILEAGRAGRLSSEARPSPAPRGRLRASSRVRRQQPRAPASLNPTFDRANAQISPPLDFARGSPIPRAH